MKEGDEGDRLFVTARGKWAAYKGETKVFEYKGAGCVFGELALLYASPRAATVKAEVRP